MSLLGVIAGAGRRRVFDPLSLSPALWLDASDADTLFDATTGGSAVAADGTIARWEDKSGNARHATQATVGYRPIRKTAIKNGLDVVRFDGSDDVLITPATMPDLQGHTIFAVEQHSGFGGLNFGRIVEVGSLLRVFFLSLITGGTETFRVFGGAVKNSLDNSAPINVFKIAAVVRTHPIDTAANTNFYVNGTESNGGGSDDTSASSLNATAQIGNNTARNRGFPGDIAELLIYPTALSTTDRQAVESYLAAKWDITL